MKNSKQSHELIRQNEQTVKQSQKHDANLQKNSILYFQVGLIVCLLAAFGLLEMQFESSIPQLAQETVEPNDPFEMEAPNFKIYVEPKVQTKQKTEIKKMLFINKVDVKDDQDPVIETFVDTPDSYIPDEPLDPNSLDFKTIDEEPEVKFVNVEEVPIYPGCEKKKDNEARKKCMSDKITKLVQRKFNGSNIASIYGLSGKQRISVEFLIDKTGKVTNIKPYARHPKLVEEAKRVVNKIPEMQPGKQRDKPVGVRYTLPIVFMVH